MTKDNATQIYIGPTPRISELIVTHLTRTEILSYEEEAMRKEVAVLVVVSVVLLTSASSSKVIDFEAARGMSNGILRTRQDGKRTVYLKMNQYVANNFFVNSSCLVTVDNVVYSNDKSGYRVNIRIGLNAVGSFTTQSPVVAVAPGEQWNELRNSGRVGDSKWLQQGFHFMTLTANHTNCSGVEICTISLNFVCDPEPTPSSTYDLSSASYSGSGSGSGSASGSGSDDSAISQGLIIGLATGFAALVLIVLCCLLFCIAGVTEVFYVGRLG